MYASMKAVSKSPTGMHFLKLQVMFCKLCNFIGWLCATNSQAEQALSHYNPYECFVEGPFNNAA
jgi:hypothetical protein